MRYHIHSLTALALLGLGCAGGIGEVGGSTQEKNATTNPFKGVNFFLNPEFKAHVEQAATHHPEDADRIRKVAHYPTGVWLSDIKSVANLQGWLDEAKKQQDASGKPTLTVILVYDLPERVLPAATLAAAENRPRASCPSTRMAKRATAPTSSIQSRRSSKLTRTSPSRSCSNPTHLATWPPICPFPSARKPSPRTATASSTPSRASTCRTSASISMPATRGGWAGTTTGPRSPKSSRTCSTMPADRR